MDKNIQPINSVLFLAKVPVTSAGCASCRADEKKSYRQTASVPELDPETTVRLVAYDFDSDLDERCIAFHPIYGSVRYDYSWYWFSTKQLVDDLLAAEANPNIIGHLIHVDSNGGEAFGLHEAWDVIRNLKKPCIAVIDSMAASAGYYLACGADKVYAGSRFSMVGCIGTMCVFTNWDAYDEKHGIKEIELYSNYSPLKNKVIKDAMNGNGDEYVKRFLDPMAFQFIEDVRAARASVAEDSDATKGEIFYAGDALAQGLIDGELSIEGAIAELVAMAPAPAPAADPIQQPSIDINNINF